MKERARAPRPMSGYRISALTRRRSLQTDATDGE
jgi:hypothetical protein